ncbi:MAG: hypothetical protein COA50_10815 [Flavobacteriaceae bacterium]|nr:MAG: hypothetical protein COA50_10815 [Flavobacteriaceae bacterium]
MKKFSQLLLAATVLVVSCSDETTVFTDPLDDSDGNVRLETNEQILEGSIVYDNAGVIDIFEEDQITGKSSKSGDEELAGDYPLTLVAQVDPPTFSGGENLTASHVHVLGDYAYVSYNTVESGYAGGVDIINVSDPTNPRVTSRLYYSNADINALKYENGYVYAVGGVDAELSVRATSNSFLAKIPVSNGRMDTGNISYGFHQGFVSTDVETTATTILVTSGKDGSLTVYNKSDLEILEEIPFADLRSVAIQGDKIALLDGSKGVSILNQNFDIIREIPIDTDFGIAKRTVDFSGNKIIVSEGLKGAGVYDYTTGTFIEYVPILVNPEGVASSDIVTNAVAVNENVILMANGGAGLCLSEEQNDNTDLVGIVELEGSINYVETLGDYVFAASGKEGLQIIKLNRPDESLEAKCADVAPYSGSSRLNVNEGDDFAYRGSKRFRSINVNGNLLLCGSWTVRDAVNMNSDALFEMSGTLVVGRNNRKRDIVVNQGAVLRIEGNLTIYGDLVLNDGATIEFIGDDSIVNIFGSVNKSGTVTVEGPFDDVKDKF